jgi:hypothetical protein
MKLVARARAFVLDVRDAHEAWRVAVGEGVPTAMTQVGSALDALGTPQNALTRAALDTNFAAARLETQPARVDLVGRVLATFAGVREVLSRARRTYAPATARTVRRAFPPGAAAPPAYAIHGDRVYVTSAFLAFGPMCRAAMVLHEAVHLVDPRSGEPDIHVSEWDEPRFSSLSSDQAVHNPSSYASFAGQVHAGRLDWPREARFGAGNPRV